MGSIQLLSALNWAMAILYLAVGLFIVSLTPTLATGLSVLTLFALIASPHLYLGYWIDKGRGRTLQTIMAVLSLFSFPLGTAFGIFALWTLSAAPEAGTPEDASGSQNDAADDAAAEDGVVSSPYALARALHQRGVKGPHIRARLEKDGLGLDELKTIFRALDMPLPARLAVAPARAPKRPR